MTVAFSKSKPGTFFSTTILSLTKGAAVSLALSSTASEASTFAFSETTALLSASSTVGADWLSFFASSTLVSTLASFLASSTLASTTFAFFSTSATSFAGASVVFSEATASSFFSTGVKLGEGIAGSAV